jgi:hypothetical protein
MRRICYQVSHEDWISFQYNLVDKQVISKAFAFKPCLVYKIAIDGISCIPIAQDQKTSDGGDWHSCSWILTRDVIPDLQSIVKENHQSSDHQSSVVSQIKPSISLECAWKVVFELDQRWNDCPSTLFPHLREKMWSNLKREGMIAGNECKVIWSWFYYGCVVTVWYTFFVGSHMYRFHLALGYLYYVALNTIRCHSMSCYVVHSTKPCNVGQVHFEYWSASCSFPTFDCHSRWNRINRVLDVTTMVWIRPSRDFCDTLCSSKPCIVPEHSQHNC